MKIGLLYSGGIDCFLARWFLDTSCRVDPNALTYIYYMLGTRYTQQEYAHLRGIEEELSLHGKLMYNYDLSLGHIEQNNAYVPCRNPLMAIHACGAYELDVLYIGGTKSDRVSDNNEQVFDQVSALVSDCLERPVRVTSPFFNKYKVDLAREYCNAEVGGSVEDLLKFTFSCYKPQSPDGKIGPGANAGGQECLNCNACFRKNVILYACGYKRNFGNKVICRNYLKEFRNKEDARAIATMEYLKSIGY